MVNGLTVVSSLPPLALLPLSLKPSGANSLIDPATAIWMPFTWTLPLVIAFLLVASATHSSLLIGLLGTIGLLASNPFPRTAISLPFTSFVRRLDLLPVDFTVTVIPNYLGPPSLSISSTTAQRSSQLQLNANLRMVSLNLIGK